MMGRQGDSGSTRRAAATGRLCFAWGLCLVLLGLAVPLGVRVGAGVAALRFLGAFLGGQALKFDSGPDPVQTPKPDPAAGRPPRREPVLLAGGAAADLWRPEAPGRYPVLLVRTPYLKT